MSELSVPIDRWVVLAVAIAAFASLAANLPLIVACRRHGVRNPGGFHLRLLLGQTPSQFLYLGFLFPVAALAATLAAVRFLRIDLTLPETIESQILNNFWVILIVGIPVSLYVVYSDSMDTTPDFFLLKKDLAEKSSVAADCIYDAIETCPRPSLVAEIRKITFMRDFDPPSNGTATDIVSIAIAHVAEEINSKRKERADRWLLDFDQNAPELHKSILFLQSIFLSLSREQQKNDRDALIDPLMALADKAELAVVTFFVWNFLILFSILGILKSRQLDSGADIFTVEASLFVVSAILLFWYVPLRYYTRRGMRLLSGNRAQDFGGTLWAALIGLFVLIVVVGWIDPDVGSVVFKLLPIMIAAGGLLLTHFRFGIARNIIGSRVSIRKLGMFAIFYLVILFFTGVAWSG